MLTELHSYYDARGIGALRFACPHRHQCAAESPRFTTAKEAYVGPEYEKGPLPRVLFLSLDSGSADSDPASKTLEANREWMRVARVSSFPQGRHWFETHALAWFLLRQFKPDLTIERIGPYFAHTNSAKCCLNNPGRAVASEVLFRNCRAFIPDEIRILRPDILVTQGDYARDAVVGAFEVGTSTEAGDGKTECRVTILGLSATQKAIWLHTYHPSAYGRYWSQKHACWPFFAQAVTEFMAGCPSSSGARPEPSPLAPVVMRRPELSRPTVQVPTSAPPSRPVSQRAPGREGSLDMLVGAFNAVFRVDGRPFGTPHGRFRGVSDDAHGVQWNAGVDRELGTAWLGVNLEGMAYSDWPIARLIERELGRPSLPDLCRTVPEAAAITMAWLRDAWQAAARLPIAESHIGQTPITLDRLTPDIWRAILLEAHDCLDPDKNHRGRARQMVTLRSGRVEKTVSPHFHVNYVLWRTLPQTQNEAEALARRGLEALRPVYEFVRAFSP